MSRKILKELLLKEAASSNLDKNDLLRKGVKNINDQIPPSGILAKLNQPENFGYKTTVRSRLEPEFDIENAKASYKTQHSGVGRRSQNLEAHRDHGDFLRGYLQDNETEDAYDKRVGENVKQVLEMRRRANKKGLLTGAGITLAGGALGPLLFKNNKKDNLAAKALAGAGIGSVPGVLLGAGIISHGHRKSKNHFLSSLKPHEQEMLREVLKRDADEISQDIRKADRYTGTSVYYR